MFGISREEYKSLPMRLARTALAEDSSIVLLDVRTEEEFGEAHIPGSRNLPLDQLHRAEQLIGSRNAKLFVYCHSGVRSAAACAALADAGYTDVTDIGGILAWDGPIEKEDVQ
ncbi:MAG: rhodanese-like domain-containing protein [Oscillospiraceae bacterium]